MLKNLVFESYDTGEHEEKTIEILPSEIKTIYFAYDGGRVTIRINGEDLLSTASGGNDMAVSITQY